MEKYWEEIVPLITKIIRDGAIIRAIITIISPDIEAKNRFTPYCIV